MKPKKSSTIRVLKSESLGKSRITVEIDGWAALVIALALAALLLVTRLFN